MRVTSGDVERLPTQPMLHVGAHSVSVHCRPLDGELVRLTLERPLPLRFGDRTLLRDPGSRQVWGARVLDPMPPPLRRRGAAVERAKALEDVTEEPDLVSEVARREVVDVEHPAPDRGAGLFSCHGLGGPRRAVADER